jgi:hypothetical protein
MHTITPAIGTSLVTRPYHGFSMFEKHGKGLGTRLTKMPSLSCTKGGGVPAAERLHCKSLQDSIYIVLLYELTQWMKNGLGSCTVVFCGVCRQHRRDPGEGG